MSEHTVRLTGLSGSHLLPTPEEMAAFDRATIAAGISSLELMERVAAALCSALQSRFDLSRAETLILCGPGNNGGDGLVIARLLHECRASVSVIVSGSARYSRECLEQIGRATQAGVPVLRFGHSDEATAAMLPGISAEAIRERFRSTTLLIDALLGTGQRAAPHGVVRDLTALFARRSEIVPRATVVAIDVPTGIDAERGALYEPHLTADLTLTVELVKCGMVQYPARAHCGEIVAIAAGIDSSAGASRALLTATSIPTLPRRARDSHKGSFGKVLIVAGCRSMPGAAALSSLGALRSGAGLVTTTQFHERGTWIPPEAILLDLPSTSGALHRQVLPGLLDALAHASTVALGPGLGVDEERQQALAELLAAAQTRRLPIVCDADGLTMLAALQRANPALRLDGIVLTPHPGEMARLLGRSVPEVQADRYAAAEQLACTTGAVVVLKGASTVVTDGRRTWVNSTGGPWMATPGSGDVLTGVIATLCGQLPNLLDAAALAVYLHGCAGDLAFHALGRGPLIASDIAQALPRAIGEVWSR